MSIVSLAVAAAQLRVELDGHDIEAVDDTLSRVESLVLDHLERDAYEDDEEIPAGVKQAVLLALTTAYDNREADPLTPAVIALLSPFRSPGVW